MGLERLVLLLEVAGSQPGDRAQPHAYWVLGDAAAQRFAFVLAERLRDRLPWLRLQMHCGEGRMKAQMKKADRSGATLVLIVGEEELAAGQVSVRGLREGGPEQSRVGADALADYLAQQIVTR